MDLLLRQLLVLWLGAAGTEAQGTHDHEALHHRLRQVRAQVGDDLRTAFEAPFVVVSDQSEKDFERSRRRTIRWAVRILKKDFFPKDPQEIVVIYLFDGEDSYRKHAKELFDDEPDTHFGYYSRAHRALIMNIATGGGTLVHEIVHAYMEYNFPTCPAWFDEGLASLFEACRERGGHIEGLLNWRLPILKRGIKEGRLVPLATLLATTSSEFYADPMGMHYAEARYLLYYVQQRGKLRAYYRQIVANSRRDPSGAQALLAVMGVGTIEQLERDWLTFVESLSR